MAEEVDPKAYDQFIFAVDDLVTDGGDVEFEMDRLSNVMLR
jgi:hypothetical protein